jgi:hypothetical protein
MTDKLQMIPFYKVVRLLLFPLLSERELNVDYLKICADASAGICRAYKRLHRIYGADCSPFAVQSLFLSGEKHEVRFFFMRESSFPQD